MRILVLIVVPTVLGALIIALVPPWQMPDEPAHFEYAALWVYSGALPHGGSYDADLDSAIGVSLVRTHFYSFLLTSPPHPPPTTLSAARTLFFMPSQLGGDPPLAYAPAALLINQLRGASIEMQLRAMRSLNLLYTVGAVLCIYAAALQLTADRNLALASGLLAGLQPQFLFTGVTAGNDALTNLLGAAVCVCLVAGFRTQVSGFRRLLLFGALPALVLAGLGTKRGFVSIAAALFVVGAVSLCQQVLGRGRGPRTAKREPRVAKTRPVVLWLLFGAVFIVALPAFADTGDPQVAADWHGPPSGVSVLRIERSAFGEPALLLPAGSSAEQHLPLVIGEWAQDGQLRFAARVWSDAPAQGRLLIDDGWEGHSLSFTTGPQATVVTLDGFIPLYAPQLHLKIVSDAGQIFAADLRASAARQPDLNLLRNGDLRQRGSIQGGNSLRIDRYLPLRELQWAWQSGRLFGPMPAGPEVPRLLFVSFWGQFGWMSLPLVGGTLWEPLLLGVCLGGLLGVVRFIALPTTAAWQRLCVLVLLWIVALATAAPLLNSYLQPRAQALPQGRYLFPAFAPVAVLLTLGWRALMPTRLQLAGFVFWIVLWGSLAMHGLWLLTRAY
jgi:hypothetical protein